MHRAGRWSVVAVVTLGLAVVACGPGEESFVTTKPPVATVSVDMDSFTMKPSQATAPKGPVKFIARNIHAKDVHELAVLRIRPDGTKQNAGEVEDLDAGATGEIVLDLPAGKYELACLIAKGEAGSLVGHYEAGMHVPFEVR